MIKTHFLAKYTGYDTQLDLTIDPDMLKRWILKICFNYSRIRKDDEHIFENAFKYILYGNKMENINFTLFMGLHVNTSPLPEEFYEYTPIQIYLNPSLNFHSYYISTHMGWDLNLFKIKLPYIRKSYSVRFGSAVFYLIIWNNYNEIDLEEFKHNICRLEEHFN